MVMPFKQTHTPVEQIRRPEINIYIYSQLISGKSSSNNTPQEGRVSPTNSIGESGYTHT